MTAAVVDLGPGSAEDFRRRDVRGRIVLVSSAAARNAPPLHRSQKYELAVDGGAVGFAFYGDKPGGVVPMGSARLTAGLGSIPAVGISHEDAMYVSRKAGEVQLEITSDCSSREAVSCNGIALKTGTAGGEIVVCGHIDSWFCEGAYDNGSGVAMLLELGRLLQPYRLARAIRFITFGSEEPGLLGSKAYVASRKDLSEIVCVLNLDSTAIRDGTLTITTNENRGLHEFFLLLGRQLHLDLEMHEERTLYSDHDPFRARGVPCAAFLSVSPRYAFAHSLYDTLDKLSPESFTIPLIAAGVGVIECAMREDLVFTDGTQGAFS